MEEPKYINIPVDPETKRKLEALCAAYEMGKRGQGAMVRKLVNREYAALESVKLLPGTNTTSNPG